MTTLGGPVTRPWEEASAQMASTRCPHHRSPAAGSWVHGLQNQGARMKRQREALGVQASPLCGAQASEPRTPRAASTQKESGSALGSPRAHQ